MALGLSTIAPATQGALQPADKKFLFSKYQETDKAKHLAAIIGLGGVDEQTAEALAARLVEHDEEWAQGILADAESSLLLRLIAASIVAPESQRSDRAIQYLQTDHGLPVLWSNFTYNLAEAHYLSGQIEWTLRQEILPRPAIPFLESLVRDGLDSDDLEILREKILEIALDEQNRQGIFELLPFYLSESDDWQFVAELWKMATEEIDREGIAAGGYATKAENTLAGILVSASDYLDADSQTFQATLAPLVPLLQKLESGQAPMLFGGARNFLAAHADSPKVQLAITDLLLDNPGGLYRYRAELIGLLRRSPSPVSPESAWHQRLQKIYERELADLEAAAKLLEP